MHSVNIVLSAYYILVYVWIYVLYQLSHSFTTNLIRLEPNWNCQIHRSMRLFFFPQLFSKLFSRRIWGFYWAKCLMYRWEGRRVWKSRQVVPFWLWLLWREWWCIVSQEFESCQSMAYMGVYTPKYLYGSISYPTWIASWAKEWMNEWWQVESLAKCHKSSLFSPACIWNLIEGLLDQKKLCDLLQFLTVLGMLNLSKSLKPACHDKSMIILIWN